jgi:hypothetical protein
MTSTAIDLGATTHQGRTGLQYPQQEQHLSYKLKTASFSSSPLDSLDVVYVDATTYIAASFGLTPSFAAVIAELAGIAEGGAS